MGWLHSAMLTRQPFALCIYVHALERRRERQRLKLAYRRLFTINRGAESRGRVPDFDRYVQEREYEGLLGQLATGQQTGLFHVSIYEQLSRRSPWGPSKYSLIPGWVVIGSSGGSSVAAWMVWSRLSPANVHSMASEVASIAVSVEVAFGWNWVGRPRAWYRAACSGLLVR
jgi:hypothetical protein